MIKTEILAPAGSPDSLIAAVRCGANAVYLGGKSFNARQNATNFDDSALFDAVKYCRARNVKVYLALNTLLFDSELSDMEKAVQTACIAGIDALIVQDLSVAVLVREQAPSMPLHASTQMSIHSLSGAKALERLGFSRVVLARELSKIEIAEIRRGTNLELECFVHGALCMCVSGQCYFSAMLGGRSGNRGLCAQPCRLPVSNGKNDHALSLKDLSLIERLPELIEAGVSSFKIEGRMKRSEYVAAAVTAVKQKLEGESPDLDTLRSVFSRDGFTGGYFDGKTDYRMFGTRRREDVVSASPALLNKLAATFKNEKQSVPVTLSLSMKRDMRSKLTANDEDGYSVTSIGDIPQDAATAPTTVGKASAALSKSGGTPFLITRIDTEIDDGLMLPASALNALRRDAFDDLLKLRETITPHEFIEPVQVISKGERYRSAKKPELRVRLGSAEQFSPQLADAAGLITIHASELKRLDSELLKAYAHKIAVEYPRILFGQKRHEEIASVLKFAIDNNITHVTAGNIGMIEPLRELGFKMHGDFSLNITNTPALCEYERLGLSDAILSFELTKGRALALGGGLPRGILAYGFLPLMLTRNCPIGNCKGCAAPALTDRLGNKLPVRCSYGVSEIYNCIPLYLADRLDEFHGLDFFTLYFTFETPADCVEILKRYQNSSKTDSPQTRGLYFRGVN